MEIYKFEVKENTLYLHINDGYYLPQRIRVATEENPMVHITTNNQDDLVLSNYLPKLKGAKKLVDEVRPNYDEDPYGRRVQRGTRPYQIWDLSQVFK